MSAPIRKVLRLIVKRAVKSKLKLPQLLVLCDVPEYCTDEANARFGFTRHDDLRSALVSLHKAGYVERKPIAHPRYHYSCAITPKGMELFNPPAK